MMIYDNVDQLRLAFLNVGQIVKTKGYYLPGDGGEAEYQILNATSPPPDDYGNVVIADGKEARLQTQNNMVNVRQFGLRDEALAGQPGPNNDAVLSVAINYLRDLSLSTGEPVTLYFPTGLYLLEAARSIQSFDRLTAKGDGRSSSVLRFNGTSQNSSGALCLFGNSINLVVRDLGFDGGPDNTNTTDGAFVSFVNCQDALVIGCSFRTEYSSGWRPKSGVRIDSSQQLLLTGCHLDFVTPISFRYNIELTSSGGDDAGVVIANNTLDNGGIYVSQMPGVQINNNKIYRPGFPAGVYISRFAEDASVTSNTVTYAEPEGAGAFRMGAGIDVRGRGCLVSGSRCRLNAGPGINCSGPYTLIVGNQCSDNGNGLGIEPGERSGIRLAQLSNAPETGGTSNPNASHVVGNRCFNDVTPNQDYGLTIPTSGQLSSITVEANNFLFNAVGEALLDDAVQNNQPIPRFQGFTDWAGGVVTPGGGDLTVVIFVDGAAVGDFVTISYESPPDSGRFGSYALVSSPNTVQLVLGSDINVTFPAQRIRALVFQNQGD